MIFLHFFIIVKETSNNKFNSLKTKIARNNSTMCNSQELSYLEYRSIDSCYDG